MYELRLSRLFLFFAGLLLLVLVRCFALQVLDQGGHAQALEKRLTSEFLVLPRRGDILYADGSPLATNRPGYAADIDFRAFDAHRWRCSRCDAIRTRRNQGPKRPAQCAACDEKRPAFVSDVAFVNPSAGRFACKSCEHAVDVTTPPPDTPESCRSCGVSGTLELVTRPDLVDLAHVLGISAERVEQAVVKARLRSQARTGRTRFAEYPLLRSITREAAVELQLRANEFPGITPRAVRARWTDPLADQVAGRVRLPWKEDFDRLSDEARAARGLRVYSAHAVYNTLFGHTGLEGEFDEQLRGDPGRGRRKRETRHEYLEPVIEEEVIDGRDVRTTLSRPLQQVAHDIVSSAEYAAAAVVLDIRDGAVLAIASKSDDGYNHAVCDIMPGSVYKLVPALAVLRAGKDPHETFECTKRGRLPGSGRRYNCLGYHPEADLATAFEKSCNYYFMVQAESVGVDAMLEAAQLLGFGRSETVHLRGAPAGLAKSPGQSGKWFEADLHQLAMGQGRAVSCSPLQVAIAYARIASGGRRIRPYLVQGVGPHAQSNEIDPELARYAPILRDAARRVVVSGTARKVDLLQELNAAGKSGTAQVVAKLPDGTREMTNNPWFVGYAPADNPEYVAVVVLERVRGGGGSTCGPLVAKLLEAALRR